MDNDNTRRAYQRVLTMAASTFFVPFQKPDLVGREDDLARLHDLLRQGSTLITAALVGQGGVGKTQLAVLYAYTYAEEYPGGIFWLDAAEPQNVVPQLADYATQMALPALTPGGDQAEYLRQRALQWVGQVRHHSDMLLIFDNLGDDTLLRNVPGLSNLRLSSLGCRLLITSRRRELPRCTALPLDVLLLEQAQALLMRESGHPYAEPDEHQALNAVCELLGGLPLALRLAGALLKRSPLSLRTFADTLRKQGAVRVMDYSYSKARLEDYEKSLTAVLVESWNSIPSEQLTLKEILLALGCLPLGQRIPLSLMHCLLTLLPDPLGLFDPWEEALQTLYDRHLLERPSADTLRLHPLIHAYAAGQCPPGFSDRLAKQAAATLRSAAYLGQTSAAGLLALLGQLPLLRPLTATESEAARQLQALERVLDLQAHCLRAGLDPLPHLHRHACLLNDRSLAETLAEVLTWQPRFWLRQHWGTLGIDPALRRVLQGHKNSVNGCALSGDGATALSASWDHTLRVWDTRSGECRAVLQGHADWVTGCALSEGGATALSASRDHTLRVWDTRSGKCRAVLQGHTDGVLGCALSGDGAMALSASWDHTLRVWDTRSGECRAVFQGHKNSVNSCALSGDGITALSASEDGTLRVWDTRSGKCRAVLQGHTDEVTSCALSRDIATALSASRDRTLRVWDTHSGECRAVLQGHTDGVLGCALSGDGITALSASEDRTLRAWDTRSSECSAVFQGHTDGVLGCALSGDGITALSASWDHTLRVWDTRSGECRPVFQGHTDEVTGCALSGDAATALSASRDRTLRVWDTHSGECRVVLEGHTDGVLGCALSGDGATALSASRDRTLRVWDTHNGECRAVLQGHTGGVLDCALSGDGSTALSASEDRMLRVWDTHSGECRAVLQGHADEVTGCALSRDAIIALSASQDSTLRVWDTRSGECRAVLQGHTNGVQSCALSEDGTTALSTSWDQTLRVWDTHSGECRAVLQGHADEVTGCALSRDAATALSASRDHTLWLWDVRSGECQLTLYLEGVRACILLPDGRWVLVGASAGGVILFDLMQP